MSDVTVDALSGQRLPAAEGSWTYTEIDGTFCRDGSPAGVAVNLGHDPDKLMIYMEQGGACFEELSCLANPANTALDLVGLGWLTAGDGLFNRSQAENPVRDWTFVYVPYCTGDLHMGSKPGGSVPNVGPQRFVGYDNMQKFMPRIAATVPNPKVVLLAGASAGGFGSITHVPTIQRAFPESQLRVLDDAGPPTSTAILGACLQDEIRTLWGLDQTILRTCGDDCKNRSDYIQDNAAHTLALLGDQPFGLLISNADVALRRMADASANDCAGTGAILNPSTPGSVLEADLLALRKRLGVHENFSSFYPQSDVHTWTASADFYTLKAGGVRAVDWVKTLVSGETPANAGP